MIFLEKYNHIKNIRFPLFKKTIEISIKRKQKVIVETGTSRGKKKFFFFKKFNWKDGMSTIIFSEYAKFANGKLHSCDLSKENIKNATDFTKEFSNNVQFYVEDSVVFLKNFNQKIDLLYLDSFDGHNVELASKHQLKEAEMAINKLNDDAIVLLDDKGAKTLYSTDYFIKNGFKILAESNNQLLLSKSL